LLAAALLGPLALTIALVAIIQAVLAPGLAVVLAIAALCVGLFAFMIAMGVRWVASGKTLIAISLPLSIIALVVAWSRPQATPAATESAPQPAPTAALLAPQESPAMARAREKSTQIRCAANLRAIGQALHIYANDNSDRLPPDLTLLDSLGLVRPEQLQSPLDKNESNACDYLYVPEMRLGGGRRNWLVAWGDPRYTDGKGASILYLDGHVEYVEEPKLSEIMSRFLREFEGQFKHAPKIVAPH